MGSPEVEATDGSGLPYVVRPFTHVGMQPALGYLTQLDQLRAEDRMIKSSITGWWLPTRLDDIRALCQRPDIFSSNFRPEEGTPSLVNMDPPEHTQYRKLIAPLFAPSHAKYLEQDARRWCVELIEGVLDRGECDFIADFAAKYPTTIFLGLMGLPQAELPQFLKWEAEILHMNDSRDPDGAIRANALSEVRSYLSEVIAQRQRDPREDWLSYFVHLSLDGEPIPNDVGLAMCVLLFQAGLDTVTSQLSYAFLHLATHGEHRKRVVTEPGIIPQAVEELMRAYSIVISKRVLTQDTDLLGCPMKKGDTILVPLGSANRDDRAFESAADVILDRVDNAHVAFGVGPHRCIGAHLARLEMRIAWEEWHRAIPEYRVRPGAEMEEHGFMLGLESLPLVWD